MGFIFSANTILGCKYLSAIKTLKIRTAYCCWARRAYQLVHLSNSNHCMYKQNH